MSSPNGNSKLTIEFVYGGWPMALEIPEISAANLAEKLAGITTALEKSGCQPVPAATVVPVTATAPIAPAAQPVAGNEPPICKYHGPMKISKKHGGWYCPTKMGDGSWCQEKVEA